MRNRGLHGTEDALIQVWLLAATRHPENQLQGKPFSDIQCCGATTISDKHIGKKTTAEEKPTTCL